MWVEVDDMRGKNVVGKLISTPIFLHLGGLNNGDQVVRKLGQANEIMV